ncbi:MAG: 50S ribosomal protein L2 [Alphaproteobacteria bacterium]|nr:50S ribosomal protein L2 [Alphaproteobacteria bacterium]OIN85981.1 MAG: 50S ribosomal protein L2 [Alphaproteobacteria bacterium CG1_02_46_17]
MALKKYNPTTPGQRQLVLVDRSQLWKGAPEKSLTEGKHRNGGRNNTGRITMRFLGGGHKQRYRIIDFKRSKMNMEATVLRLEYDPNRTAFIALIQYEDGEKAYILAPQRLAEGDKIVSSEKADIKIGNTLPLKSMPVGTIIHNVEMKPGKGGQMARAGGTFAQLVGRDQGYAQIKLSSGEMRMVRGECLATIGAVSNPDQKNINIGKAGRNRWLGRKPHQRGISMNPVDHPHGGRTNGGVHWCSPTGVPAKGYKTRKNKATDKLIIRRRKIKNK